MNFGGIEIIFGTVMELKNKFQILKLQTLQTVQNIQVYRLYILYKIYILQNAQNIHTVGLYTVKLCKLYNCSTALHTLSMITPLLSEPTDTEL